LINTETIIAQCTPKGHGALALLRMSGPDAIMFADSFVMLSTGNALHMSTTHTIHYGTVVDTQKQAIDKVLIFLMRAPHTFTGENTIEITCHNNPFIIASIIAQAIHYGARLAYSGEFTQQAVLHEKIDLIQAEAIDELIHAHTQLALKKALAQMEGSFSHWISTIEQELITCLAFSESSFEFIDEEYMEFGIQIMQCIQKVLAMITTLKKTFNQQQQIRQGIRIALIGSVNAGKSSLFNTLIGKDRAIVTDTPGTTRDAIEAGLYKNGNYWTLIDTAGLRNTRHNIEKEGIKRSYKEAQSADIILLICDGSRPLTSQEQTIYKDICTLYEKKIIFIQSKTDLPLCEHHTNNWKNTITELESPFLLNQRQYNLVLTLEKNLIHIIPLLETYPIAYELISYHLNDALKYFAELTGKSISEAAMDAIFRNFCVGK
jgi:tRNA modification GTPase